MLSDISRSDAEQVTIQVFLLKQVARDVPTTSISIVNIRSNVSREALLAI